MSISVDARGRSCPEPVMMTKKALEQGKDIEITVDSKTALDNIERYIKKEGYEINIEEKEAEFLIKVKR